MLTFHRFDPAPCGFPGPRVTVLPRLRAQSLSATSSPLQSEARWYRHGRYALKEAYRLAGVGPAGALLAPAYHCRTMLDPAIAMGADVLVYPVKGDLTPDMVAMEAIVASATQPVKALVVPHYFGFPQRLQDAAIFCERHGLRLVEDCSHVLAGVGGSAPALGGTGDYAVASPYKFFPSADGGLLWSRLSPLGGAAGPAADLRDEVRGAANLLSQLAGRREAPNVDRLAEDLAAAMAGTHAAAREWIDEGERPSTLYDFADEAVSSLASSRWIARHTDLSRLMRRRREHYRQWLRAVQGLPHCEPLFPVMPDNCVPYMFPLRIERPQVDFYVLKRLGVPIWRWDEMAVSSCDVAASYRLSLLHLPCHQELSADEMNWMTAAVVAVCGRPPLDDEGGDVE